MSNELIDEKTLQFPEPDLEGSINLAIQQGFLKIVGKDENGQDLLSLTEEGKKQVESMMKKGIK